MGMQRKAAERQSVQLPFPCPMPRPCYGRQQSAASWPQPASEQLGVVVEEDAGSPVAWLGLIQTLPHPLTAPRSWQELGAGSLGGLPGSHQHRLVTQSEQPLSVPPR